MLKLIFEVQDQETGKVTATFEKAACGTLDVSETSELMHNFELPSFSSVDKQMQATGEAREENMSIRELDMVSKPNKHPVDLIVMPLSEQTIGAPENKSVIVKFSKDNPSVEVPYIDFIFGDQRWKSEDCYWMLQTKKLKYLVVILHIQAKFRDQKKPRVHSPFTWMKRSITTSKPCQGDEDQEAHRGFVRFTFDPGGRLHNWWTSSLQEGES